MLRRVCAFIHLQQLSQEQVLWNGCPAHEANQPLLQYGEIEGVITLTDLLEALVGDLPAVGEPTEQQAVQREDGSWLLDGSLAVDELQDLLGLEHLPDQNSGYETLGGLVMHQLGRIPAVADSFEWAGWRFEVMDMDGRRVDKVLAIPLRPSQSSSQQR